MFAVRFQAQLGLYPFYNVTGNFNVEALREALGTRAGSWKTVLVLNFPNSPTGFSVTKSEADRIVRVLCEAADAGRNLIVVVDDAYFGLQYEEDLLGESLFARLAGCHERILAVKVDGASEENFVWGFRIGMLTFSTRAFLSDEALYAALEKKVAGAIRSSVSNCSRPAQSILLKSMSTETWIKEWQSKKGILQSRARRARDLLKSADFADVWQPYPFNAGYFMCLKLKGLDAEAYRKYLLQKYGIGVIADNDRDVRVALSSIEEKDLENFYQTMATAARELHEAERGK
jgi:aspartate/methionine/tyrosine aminotransferase